MSIGILLAFVLTWLGLGFGLLALSHFISRRRSVAPVASHTDAGDIIMAILAQFQTIIDELNALPAKIAADRAAAVAASEATDAQSAQDLNDTVSDLQAATDAIKAA